MGGRHRYEYMDDPNGEQIPLIIPAPGTPLRAEWDEERYEAARIAQELMMTVGTGNVPAWQSRLYDAIVRNT